MAYEYDRTFTSSSSEDDGEPAPFFVLLNSKPLKQYGKSCLQRYLNVIAIN